MMKSLKAVSCHSMYNSVVYFWLCNGEIGFSEIDFKPLCSPVFRNLLVKVDRAVVIL